MYKLYVSRCREENTDPVKSSFYRTAFNNEFNIAFHGTKSDRCDRCEVYKFAKIGERFFASNLTYS